MMRPSYVCALGAALLSLGMTGNGHASLVWFRNQDIPIPANSTGVYIDLSDGTTDTSGPFAGGDANFWFGGYLIGNEGDLPAVPAPSWQPVRLTADSLATIANLAPGTLVDGGSTFGSGFGGSSDHVGGEFTDGIPGFIGFSLDNGGGPLYGWMEVTLSFDPDAGTGGVIHQWAFEDNGGALAVAVPEPTTWTLALLGLALAVRRRR